MSNLQEKAEKFAQSLWGDCFDATPEHVEKAVIFGYELCQQEYEEKLRWIPVEERMPDYGVEVFVKYEDTLGTIHPNPAYTVDYAVATSHSKKGFSIEVDYSGRTKEKVTHWHPISFL